MEAYSTQQEFIYNQETSSIISNLNPKLRSFIILLGSQESARQSFYKNFVKKRSCNNLEMSDKLNSEKSVMTQIVSSKSKLKNSSDIVVFIEENKIWFNLIDSPKKASSEEEKRIQELIYYSNKLLYFIEVDKSINIDEVQNKLAFFLGLDDIDEPNRDFSNLEILVCVSITYSATTVDKLREKENLFKFEKFKEKNIKIGFHYFPYVNDDYDSEEYLSIMNKFYESSLENLKNSNCLNFFGKKLCWISKQSNSGKDKIVPNVDKNNIDENLKEIEKQNLQNFDYYDKVRLVFDKFCNVDDDISAYEKGLEKAKTYLKNKKIDNSTFNENEENIIKNEEKIRKSKYDENKIKKKIEEKSRKWKNEISDKKSSNEIELWLKKKLLNCTYFNYKFYIKEKKKKFEEIFNECIQKFTFENDFKNELRKFDNELCKCDSSDSEKFLEKICTDYIESSRNKESSYNCYNEEIFSDLMNLSKYYFNKEIHEKKKKNSLFLEQTINSFNKKFNLKIKEINSDPYRENPYIIFSAISDEFSKELEKKMEYNTFLKENKEKLNIMIEDKKKYLEASIKNCPELILDKIKCFNTECGYRGGLKFIDKTRKNTINLFDAIERNREDKIKCNNCEKEFYIFNFANRSYRFEKNFKGELRSIDYD